MISITLQFKLNFSSSISTEHEIEFHRNSFKAYSKNRTEQYFIKRMMTGIPILVRFETQNGA